MTYKVVSSGEIDSLSITPNFDEALALLFPALMNLATSGRIENCETGEVLLTVENGETTYIEENTLHKMIDDLFECVHDLISELAPESESYFG